MQVKWGFVWIKFFFSLQVIKMNESLKPQVLSISVQNQRESRVGCILFSSQCLKQCYSCTVCSVIALCWLKFSPAVQSVSKQHKILSGTKKKLFNNIWAQKKAQLLQAGVNNQPLLLIFSCRTICSKLVITAGDQFISKDVDNIYWI